MICEKAYRHERNSGDILARFDRHAQGRRGLPGKKQTMSIKPLKLPRFGATSPGVVTGSIVEPSEAKKNAGFVVRERPASQVISWLFELIYEWLQYLSDGALSGNHSIAGVLVVGGQALTFGPSTFTADNTTEIFTVAAHGLVTGDGPLRVSTTTTLPSGLTAGTNYWAIVLTANTFKLATSFTNAVDGLFLSIASNGTGTHTIVSFGAARPFDARVTRGLAVNGNVTVDMGIATGGGITAGSGMVTTSLVASGLINANGGVTVATGQAVTLAGTATLTAGGLITGNAGVAAGTNQDVTVTGTGRHRHATRTKIFGPASMTPISFGAGSLSISTTFTQQSSTQSALIDIGSALETGKTITAFRAYVTDASGSAIVAILQVSTGFSGVTSSSSTNTSSGAGANQTLTASGLSIVITAGNAYTIAINPLSSGANTYWRVEVDYVD